MLRLDRRATLDSLTWLLLALMALACCGFAAGKGFGFDGARAVLPLAVVYGLFVIRAICLRREQPRGTAAATAFAQMTLFTLLGVVLAYTVAAHAGSLWDGQLAAADRALGVRWSTVLAALDRWPVAVLVLGVAYHSLSIQMIVVILLLAHAGRFQTLRMTVAAAVLAGFVTILVSRAMPAAGNLFDPGRYRHLWPSIAWLERDLIAGLRDGTGRTLDLTQLMGIVSFPSYHATLAALFVWCAGDLPRQRVGLSAWAVLTIVATPVFGGHYLVEVLAGLALAPTAIALVRAAQARLDHGASLARYRKPALLAQPHDAA
jgi:membrane-associated phospholipid phosphatase